ncbi:MAG: hypothetical protein ACHP8B_09460 [Terriglobales bacterium]
MKDKTITLAPVNFKDAIAAALETPPERKPKKKIKVKTTKR